MTKRADAYDSGECAWWHLSEPSPELREALADGWMWPPGPVVDLGCGLGVEARYLSDIGFLSVGVDASASAIRQARRGRSRAHFLQADVTHLPFRDGSVHYLVDRGCFHYFEPGERTAYEKEARRVLTHGGRLLLRACLRAAGVRNDIDEGLLRRTFPVWQFAGIARGWIPSDTRTMETLIVRLQVA